MAPIQALIFDVFGTVVDWRSSVVAELELVGKKSGAEKATADWARFAQEWRTGYMTKTRQIAAGASGPRNVDVMHREILDELLTRPEWSQIGELWDESTRQSLNLVWHRLNGWPDSVEGLKELKKHTIIATLSNGNVRLLTDMAKHAALPWDMIFSTELFDTFKPNPKAYLETMRHLAVQPHECFMVAAHIFDLRAAASLGMRTVYVPRPDEDVVVDVKSKAEGGEVDYVVKSFIELAQIIEQLNASG
ncbi:(S)-2-haloacid dehalogenase 4A [Psilocybe cubensis]|uniref:(S)-2-haloacid dehalogenase 4A n=2 Tax=Psilocybe cubensis TaxID=181762 RepID=A0ACB8GJU1_PSICU|nr:(S)-2-haloacid dehalogenase 4A [Psilocybe cubensis]KAH9475798.1 (S)-2-haloacid dehalogenase 4A [Psilocybe cubensis]